MQGHDPSDPDLIELCLAGDNEAWERLIRRYERLVYSVPLKMRLQHDDAADVFQETFATLLQKLGSVKDRARIGLWLAATARNKALEKLTRGPAKRERALPDGFDAEDAGELALTELLRTERQNAVRQALATLPAGCRGLLEALFYEDPTPSYREIARTLGVREGSLGPTRLRCFAKLKRALDNLRESGSPRVGSRPGEVRP